MKFTIWNCYLGSTIVIACILLFLLFTGCDNIRQSIGISTKPFGKNDTFESSTKLNYKIIFGTVRGKKTEEDDD